MRKLSNTSVPDFRGRGLTSGSSAPPVMGYVLLEDNRHFPDRVNELAFVASQLLPVRFDTLLEDDTW
jgi:hypothetical protein